MRITIAGDYCPINRVAEYIEKGDYSYVLGQVRDLLTESSYSIVNFECPIDGNGKPILKQGPNFRCSEKNVEALQWAGFDCVTLANNHFKDYGDEGCIGTMKALRAGGIDYVGGGETLSAAQSILYKEIDGKRLAIVNFCENEFSIASDNHPGSAPLDLIDNYQQILKARSCADYLIVIIHGGHEYYQLPSPRMKKTYRWFVDLGADVVINHHQHCYSGYEEYKGKPIFYGLGNFCFDGNRCGKDSWCEGYLVTLDFDESSTTYSIIPYSQCQELCRIELMEGEAKESFNGRIKELNRIISNDDQLEVAFEGWCKQQKPIIEYSLTPYSGRYLRALWHRGLLPSFLSKKKIVGLYNKVLCEAHRDVLVDFLSNKVKQFE